MSTRAEDVQLGLDAQVIPPAKHVSESQVSLHTYRFHSATGCHSSIGLSVGTNHTRPPVHPLSSPRLCTPAASSSLSASSTSVPCACASALFPSISRTFTSDPLRCLLGSSACTHYTRLQCGSYSLSAHLPASRASPPHTPTSRHRAASATSPASRSHCRYNFLKNAARACTPAKRTRTVGRLPRSSASSRACGVASAAVEAGIFDVSVMCGAKACVVPEMSGGSLSVMRVLSEGESSHVGGGTSQRDQPIGLEVSRLAAKRRHGAFNNLAYLWQNIGNFRSRESLARYQS